MKVANTKKNQQKDCINKKKTRRQNGKMYEREVKEYKAAIASLWHRDDVVIINKGSDEEQ